jgi:hypothetical protein
MRTKRGGFRPEKPKQGTPRVRLKATAKNPKVSDRVRLATVSSAPFPADWRSWGQDTILEPLNAGLKRYTRHRAPLHLWA